MKIQLKNIAFVALCLLTFACKREDLTQPTIDYLHINSEQENYSLQAGQMNLVELGFSDNTELSQYKFQLISPAKGSYYTYNDGLSAEPTLAELTFQSYNHVKWDSTIVLVLSGSENNQIIDLAVPDSISGVWQTQVGVLDQGGNLTQKNYNVNIVNTALPQIQGVGTTPVADSLGSVRIMVNQTLQLQGSISDSDLLKNINVTLEKGGDTLQTIILENINAASFDMAQLAIDPIIETGSYFLYIRVEDMMGWQNRKRVRIIVSN